MTAVGIDLGTTICSVGIEDADGRVRLARLRDGSPRLRSVVSIGADGDVTVGDEAQALAPIDPDGTFAYFKRSMGTDWSVRRADREWSPEQLSAELLKALVADTTLEHGSRPSGAAVTIPAYFGDDARRATQQAGELAGVTILSMPHEPTAACLAYEPEPGTTSTQLVYDLGGGTFDVSVVRFTPGGAEVIATAGDHQLGGKDWDDVIVGLVADRVESATGVDPRDDDSTYAELLERARTAKHALSTLSRTAVAVSIAGRLERIEVTRAEFDQATAPLQLRTASLTDQVLDDIGRRKLDSVLLVGGSSRMPRCRDSLVSVTGVEPRVGIDPDAAVVIGAARVARSHAEPRAGRTNGIAARREVRDVTAHALGFVVVAADGSRYVNDVMIQRNAPIPALATKRHQLAVGTGSDGVLDVYMLQGEAQRPLDTSPLGRWTFEGVPGDRSGTVDVDVSYAYDGAGVVQVTAAVGGAPLAAPRIDRDDRDLRWTEEDPAAHSTPDLAVALVIDVSGSMSGAKLAEAQDACCGFVDMLEEAGLGDRIALVPFGSSASVAAPVGAPADEVRRATRGLGLAGSTNMAHGLATGWGAVRDAASRAVVIVLTDGAPDDASATLVARDRINAGAGEIIARGVSGADQRFLRLLDGGSQLLAAGEVAAGFRGIARQLTSRTSALGPRSR